LFCLNLLKYSIAVYIVRSVTRFSDEQKKTILKIKRYSCYRWSTSSIVICWTCPALSCKWEHV